MKEQEARKEVPHNVSRETVKRGHLTFVGPAPELLAKVLHVSCCLYVSARGQRAR